MGQRQTETSHSAKCSVFEHLYRRSAHSLSTKTNGRTVHEEPRRPKRRKLIYIKANTFLCNTPRNPPTILSTIIAIQSILAFFHLACGCCSLCWWLPVAACWPIVFPLNRIARRLRAHLYVCFWSRNGARLFGGSAAFSIIHFYKTIDCPRQALERRLPQSNARDHSHSLAGRCIGNFLLRFCELIIQIGWQQAQFDRGPIYSSYSYRYDARLASLNLIGLFAQKIGDLMIKRLFVLC